MGAVKRHANWGFAEHILSAVLPGSTSYDPERIAGISVESWLPFDVEHRDADVVERDLLSYCVELKGPLVVVNGTSFDVDQGPFFIYADLLADFVASFDVSVRDYFVNGSVVIVSPATGIVVIVHEDGFIATVRGRAVLVPECACDQRSLG